MRKLPVVVVALGLFVAGCASPVTKKAVIQPVVVPPSQPKRVLVQPVERSVAKAPAPAPVPAPMQTPAPEPVPVQPSEAPLTFPALESVASGLLDRSWRLAGMNGETFEGIVLRFEGKTASGTSGCSQFESVRVIREGPDMRFAKITPEARRCDGYTMDFQQRYLDALRKVRRFEVEGDQLVLTGVGTRLSYFNP